VAEVCRDGLLVCRCVDGSERFGGREREREDADSSLAVACRVQNRSLEALRKIRVSNVKDKTCDIDIPQLV